MRGFFDSQTIREMNGCLRRGFRKLKKSEPEKLIPPRRQIKQAVVGTEQEALRTIMRSGEKLESVEDRDGFTVFTTTSDKK